MQLWDTELGKRILTLPERQSEVWDIAWSPDGDRLAVARSDGGIAIWNLPSVRQRLAELDLAW